MKTVLTNAGITADEYKQISTEIHGNNRQNLMIFSVIASSFLLCMFVLSFVVRDISKYRWIYFITMFITTAQGFTAKLCYFKHPKVLLVDMYSFVSVLFIFGIMLGVYINVNEYAVTFIALLLTVPMLFTDKPIRMSCFIYVYIIVFVIFVINVKEGYVVTVDIINSCVFGTISSIVSTYMMGVKCKGYLYEQKVAIMSELDMLTGMRNRNSYEKNLRMYQRMCKKSVTGIFVDVNGLHELNNTMGHEAGDQMLKFVAEKMRELFGKDDTYRIGGDEFVAFVIDGNPDEIEEKTYLAVRCAKERNYHIAVGCYTGFFPGTDMNTIIKNAEKLMYNDKRQFYRDMGIERNIRTLRKR